MGLGGSLALPVLRTVTIRRGEFHESPFLPIRVSSVANNLLSSFDCGLRNGKSAVNSTFFIFSAKLPTVG